MGANNSSANEDKIKQLWQRDLANANLAHSRVSKNNNITQKRYTILLPPPNITGSLHIGHFLNWSIQDMLMRKAYIDGLEPNWITGIDHAGIATQFIVERLLAQENTTRHELGREKFIEKIWEWKQTSENLISQQATVFGFFFDWQKKHFTMDEDYQQHVINAFVKLFRAGLISKSERITNWDTNFQTALSDLEVIEKTEMRSMYIITYYASDYEKTGNKIEIGTTRPETMFADAAICVHPDDERFKHLHGKTFLIPLINKEIPLILDTACSMEKGTGALKITPAHDMADNETGIRHNLKFVQVINKNGCMFGDREYLPQKYVGKTTLQAREMVIQDLSDSRNLVETRDWEGIVYYPEKSAQPIETIITQQWFCDVSTMAKTALERSHKIEFIPDNIKNTFAHWMNNIRPWCISRQIWWGHRIPIWYKKDGTVICAHNEKEAAELAGTDDLTQETDVLDTWFSSALWPIATQEKSSGPTDDEKFIPTDMLVTGKDILFFWVARMIMFTLYFKNEIPFKKVYFNGIVRDKNRQKMSKTKGNVLNPLDLQAEYGKDALRFALLKQASWGKDILLETKDLEEGRALKTKFMNAAKFLTQFMSKEENSSRMLDGWMLAKINEAENKITIAIAECAFHEACNELYDLFWNNFCAWYIEGCKVAPSGNAIKFFAHILKIAHPIIPWISQETFQELESIFIPNSQSILSYIIETETTLKTIDQNEAAQFEIIMNISKFFRKMAMIGDCKTFNIEDIAQFTGSCKDQDKQFIKFFSKLKIDPNLTFSFTLYNIKLYIEKECALKAKTSIVQEIDGLKQEISTLKTRIEKGNNVPLEVLEEWKTKLSKILEHKIQLEEWVAGF